MCRYVMGIGEAEAFSERLKRELLALEAANVHALLESEPVIEEVSPHFTLPCDFYVKLAVLFSQFLSILP